MTTRRLSVSTAVATAAASGFTSATASSTPDAAERERGATLLTDGDSGPLAVELDRDDPDVWTAEVETRTDSDTELFTTPWRTGIVGSSGTPVFSPTANKIHIQHRAGGVYRHRIERMDHVTERRNRHRHARRSDHTVRPATHGQDTRMQSTQS